MYTFIIAVSVLHREHLAPRQLAQFCYESDRRFLASAKAQWFSFHGVVCKHAVILLHNSPVATPTTKFDERRWIAFLKGCKKELGISRQTVEAAVNEDVNNATKAATMHIRCRQQAKHTERTQCERRKRTGLLHIESPCMPDCTHHLCLCKTAEPNNHVGKCHTSRAKCGHRALRIR